MNIRFGEKNRQDLIGGKFLFNWALFSAPHHPVLVRTLEHIVQLLKLEYLGVSAVKMHVSDHRGKLLMCATTFPITHSIHELLLEDSKGERRDDLGIRIGGEYFKEYGARMKAWYNDFRHDHWVKVIHKNRAPYLLEYAPPHVENYEGKVIQFPGHREIYLVKNKQKRAFPNMDTLIGMNFTLDDVRVLPLSFADKIVLGAPLPVMDSESLL